MSATDSHDYERIDGLVDEFAARYRRGERPTVQEYLERYPELADDLRELLPATAAVEQAKEDFRGPAEPAPAAAPPLRQLGDYRILREIGHGGMGVVYEAEQVSLGRHVALKVLSRALLVDARQKGRFEREARAAARLHHTNIVPVFGVGEHEGTPYYVMQFIPGLGLDKVLDELKQMQGGAPSGRQDLGEDRSAAAVARSLMTGCFEAKDSGDEAGAAAVRLSAVTVDMVAEPNGGPQVGRQPAPPHRTAPEGPPDTAALSNSSVTLPGQSGDARAREARRPSYWQSIADLGAQVAGALDYAHKQGILHRDIKPANLLLDARGTVWVADFGLAKADDRQDLTHPGDILGTLRYMPPEAFEGRTDARGDVYALGLTLYELLALRPAFEERDRNRLIKQVTTGAPARLRRVNPAVPRDLVTIVEKAIERDVDRRYQTAADLAEDLHRFLADEPIKARRTGAAEQLWRWCRRNRAVATLLASVALLLVVIAVGAIVTAGRLQVERDNVVSEQVRTERANRDARRRLGEATEAEARASRFSGRLGQRFETLKAIRQAAQLAREHNDPPEKFARLRNLAISALILTDMRDLGTVEINPEGTASVDLDEVRQLYVRTDAQGNVIVRRLRDDSEVGRLPGDGARRTAAFAPDGRFVFVREVGTGGQLRAWRPGDKLPFATLGPAEGLAGVRVSLDGRRAVVGYKSGLLQVHELPSGRRLCEVRGAAGRDILYELAPSGQTLAAVFADYHQPDRERVRLFEADTGKPLGELPAGETIETIAWHPDGRTLIVSTTDSSRIAFWDVPSRRVVSWITSHRGGAPRVAINRTGDLLQSVSTWGSGLRLFHPGTGRELLRAPGDYRVFPAALPDGRFCAYRPEGRRLVRLEIVPGRERRSLVRDPARGKTSEYRTPTVSPDGRLLAVGVSGGVGLWDLDTGCEAGFLPIGAGTAHFARTGALLTNSPAGLLRWPVVADGAVRRVGPPLCLSELPGHLDQPMASDRTGTVIAVARGNRGTQLFRGVPAAPTEIWLGPQPDVRYVAVSPDGRFVASGNHGGEGVKVWDAHTGRLLKDLPGLWLSNVGFSSDGCWLAIVATSVRLWHVESWAPGPDLGKSDHWLALSPVGNLLAAGGPGVVRLFDTTRGRELAVLEDPEENSTVGMTFTPDGTRLLVASKEGLAVYVWDLRALRRQLAELGLDWEAPPYPPAPAGPLPPLRVQAELGESVSRMKAGQRVRLAEKYVRAGKHAEALAALRQAVRTAANHAEACNSLAWLLLTAPKELRDAKEALPLARNAVALAPGQYLYHNTLGVALYRTGRFAEAVPVLEKSLQQSKGRADAFDLFFLAMCHHRLGDAGKARDCRDRAQRWQRARQGKLSAVWAEELRAFEAEANAVLAEPPGPGR